MMELLKAFQGSETLWRLGWTLLHTVWLGAAVAAVLAAMLLILLRRSANARYLACCAALVMMVALPVATFFLVPAPDRPMHFDVDEAAVPDDSPSDATLQPPDMPLPEEPVADPTVEPIEPLAGRERVAMPPDVGELPSEVAVAKESPAAETPKPPMLTRASRALEPALPWVVLAWAAGVFVLSLWQLGGWIAAERLKRLATQPAERSLIETVARLARALRVSRPVRVLESVLVHVPAVVGWLRPVILLPAGLATGLTPQQLQAILAHELAHIRRYDYLVNLLQSLVETLLFYHPAVWFISRRIRAERENCCDDIAVAAGAERFSYAESLLHVAQRSLAARRGRRIASAAAIGAAGSRRPSQLRSRISRLLGGQAEETTRLSRSWPIAMIFLAGVLVATCLFVNVKAEPSVQADEGKRFAVDEPVALNAEDLERLWKDITGDDVANAWRAVRRMAAGGERTVEFLKAHKAHLELPQATPERMKQLIADLADDKYAVREKATEQLALLGPLAEPALRRALAAKPSPETRTRIETLLKMCSGTFMSRAVLRVVRARSVLEQIDTPTARKFLRELEASGIVPDVRYYQGEGHALLAGVVPDKVRCILGEPVFISFFVKNLSDKPYVFFVGGPSRGSVRDNNFRITVVDQGGKPVKDPHSYRDFGGQIREVNLKAGQVHTNRLYMGHLYAFDQPGEYKVTCKRTLNEHRANHTPVATESSFTLKILPANTERMREIIAELGRKLRRGDKQNLFEATLALAAIHDEQVVPHLAASLRRTGRRHKGVAVRALSRFSTDSAAEALCVALKDPHHRLGADAGRALKQMNKTDYAVDRLLVEFKKGTGADRAAIARALGWTISRRTTKTLVAALADEDAAVRAAAAEAIGALGDWGQIKTLKACLKDKDMGLRVAAVKGLRALEQSIQAEWLTSVILAAKGKKRAILGKTFDDLPRSFHDARSMLRLCCKDQAAPALVSCLDFDNPKTNSGYNFYIIVQIEACKNGPSKFYSEGKYHHDANTEGTPEQIEDNRLALAEWKTWLAEQEKVRSAELTAEVKQALAEAMRIRIKHPKGGLAMWQELAALVKSGWTVKQMKMILISPGGGGMMHSKGRVTVSYGVQRGAFMVIAKGKYIVGASYEKRDGDDKIILTATPTVKRFHPNTPPPTQPSGDREAKAPLDAGKLLKAFSNAKYAWMQAGPAQELIKLGDKSVIPDMLKMLKSENRCRRCNAGWVLAGLGDKRGLAAVLSELKDNSGRPTKRIRSDGKPDVPRQIRQDRYYAAHVLGKIGDRRAVPDLIDTLKDKSIAYQAAIILGNLGDPRALPALKEALKHDNADVRAYAADAIRRIEKARKTPLATQPGAAGRDATPLADVLKLSSRWKIIRGLKENKARLSDEEVGLLEKFAEKNRHHDWMLRYEAIRLMRKHRPGKYPAPPTKVVQVETLLARMRGGKVSFGHYDKHSPEIAALGNDVLETLLEMLKYPNMSDRYRRRVAIKALAVMKDARIVPALKTIAGKATHQNICEQAFLALLTQDSSDTMADWVADRIAAHDGFNRQYYAIRFLAQSGLAVRTKMRLYSHYGRYKPSSQGAVIRGLQAVDTKEAFERLVKILQKRDRHASMTAHALGQLKNSDPCEALLEALRGAPPRHANNEAILALAERKHRPAIEVLERIIEGTKGTDQRSLGVLAAGALCRLGKDYQTNAAIVRAGFHDDQYWSTSHRVVKWLDDPETIKLLISRIGKRKPNSAVTRLAIRSLGEIGNRSAITALAKSLKKLPLKEYGEVAKAVRAIGEKNNSPGLVRWSEGLRALVRVVRHYTFPSQQFYGPNSPEAKRRQQTFVLAAKWLKGVPELIPTVLTPPKDSRHWRIASLLPLLDKAWDARAVPFLEKAVKTDTTVVDVRVSPGRHVRYYMTRSIVAKFLTDKTGRQYTFVDVDGTVRKGGWYPRAAAAPPARRNPATTRPGSPKTQPAGKSSFVPPDPRILDLVVLGDFRLPASAAENHLLINALLARMRRWDSEANQPTGVTSPLNKALYEMYKMRAGDKAPFEKVERRAAELSKKYTDTGELGRIYAKVADVYGQSGNKPRTIHWVRKALKYPLDPALRLRMYMYWGDSIYLRDSRDIRAGSPSARQQVALPYLLGIREALRYSLPETRPELPRIDRFDSNPPDPELTLKHRKQVQARVIAVFIREMVFYRDILVRQLCRQQFNDKPSQARLANALKRLQTVENLIALTVAEKDAAKFLRALEALAQPRPTATRPGSPQTQSGAKAVAQPHDVAGVMAGGPDSVPSGASTGGARCPSRSAN